MRLFSLRHKVRSLAVAALAIAAGAAPVIPALAQEAHIRGEVTAVDGGKVTIATAAGQPAEVTMKDGYTLLLYRDLALEEVREGAYLGVASVGAGEGPARALAVVVFPEAMRGYNEGSSAWDLAPGSRMTNASVARLERRTGNRELVVAARGETQTISVPERTPVVTFQPAKDRRLKVGDRAILFASEGGDGTLTAGIAGISENGSLPPI